MRPGVFSEPCSPGWQWERPIRVRDLRGLSGFRRDLHLSIRVLCRATDGNGVVMGAHFFPALRSPVLRRPRLIDSWRRANPRSQDLPALLVLRGGAGAGKTLAAIEIASAQAEDRTAVWVRVQRGEGFAAFWQRVLGALVAAGAFPSESAAGHLAAGGLEAATPEMLVEALAGAEGRVLLVLDDLHHAEAPAIHDTLLTVLERVAAVSVVATTRDPLETLTSTRARMAFPVHEILEAELAFTEEELRGLLELRAPGLGRASAGARARELRRATAGWPLASHALAVELGADEAAGARLQPAQRRGRFVHDYTAGLIAAAPDPDLLRASALPRECSAPLLARMLGIEVAAAERFFAASTETGLSRWVDADGTRWYRHHDLIRAELLSRARAEVDPERLRLWYRRAAEALARSRPRDAVHAAISAQDWARLSTILVQNPVQALTSGGESGEDPWLRDVPDGVREVYPVIGAFALIAEYAAPTGRFQRVFHGLKMLAGPGLAHAAERPGLPGAVAAVMRMVAARLSGQEEMSLRMAERAGAVLAALSPDDRETLGASLGAAHTQTALTYLFARRYAEADAHLQRVTGARSRTSGWHRAHAVALSALSAVLQGRIPEARARIEEAEGLTYPVGWRDSYAGAGYRIAAAVVALETEDLDAAERHLAAMAPHASTIEHWPYLLMAEALVCERRHGAAEALLLLDSQLSERRLRSRTTASAKRELATLRARLAWIAGRAGSPRDGGRDLTGVYGVLARGDESRAGALLSGLLVDPAMQLPRRRSEALLLDAMLALHAGDRERAAASASVAARLLSEHGLALPCRALARADLERLREFAPALEPDAGHPDRTTPPPPLSAAERRALVAVSRYDSVARAAEASFVSPHTMRSQLKSAYRKLGVHRRDDAIRVARETGLLDAEGTEHVEAE